MEDEKPIDPKAPDVVNPFGEAFKNFFEPAEQQSSEQEAKAAPETEAKDTEPAGRREIEQVFQTKKEEPAPGEDDIEKLLGIKPEDLKTKSGLPVTESSRQSFRNLQKALEKKHKELEDIRKQLQEKPAQQEIKLDEIEEYKKLLEEKERYKKEVDLFAFENSDEWKQTFEAPIEQRRNRVNEIISNLELDEDDAKSASVLIRKAQEYLGDAKKEVAYSQVIDRLAQDYIKSPTAGKKFTDAMVDLFDLTVKRAEAKADREKARTEIRGKYEKQTQSSIKTLQDRLDMELMAFEKSELGQIFKSAKAKDFDYEATSKANREKALQAIKDFQVTGQVTQELAEMARHFSLKPALEKEREFFLKTNIQLSDGVNKLLKENEELKKRILDLRGEGGSQDTGVKKTTNGSKENYDPRNVFAGLEKVLAHT
jgi:hypothetical protein